MREAARMSEYPLYASGRELSKSAQFIASESKKMRCNPNRKHQYAALSLPALAAAGALLLGTMGLWGQQVTAAITGKITDPSGAPIADAKVSATDVERGTAWPTTTNAEGVYNLPRLP